MFVFVLLLLSLLLLFYLFNMRSTDALYIFVDGQLSPRLCYSVSLASDGIG